MHMLSRDEPETSPFVGSSVSVVSRRVPGSILIEVDGELDLASAPHLEDCLVRAIRRDDGTEILLDLSEVTFVDLAGWSPVVEAGDVLGDRGERLQIVGMSRCVRRLTELVGVPEGIDLEAGLTASTHTRDHTE